MAPDGHVTRHVKRGTTNGKLVLPGGCTPHLAENMVTYSIIGSGTFDLTYEGLGGTSQATVKAPWSVDVPYIHDNQFFYFSAQEADGNSSASFSCQWTLGGEVQGTSPSSGAYSICSVSN